VLLVVDAIQSLGVVPLDPSAANVGALAVDGRKWLLGPAGCGLLYVSPQWIDRIRPLAVGTQSTRHPERVMQYRDWLDADGQLDLLQAGRLAAGARRFESGFPNLVGIAGLGAALALGERIGRPAIHRRIAELVQRTVELLQAAGLEVHGPTHGGERAGIVSFEVPGSAERLFRRLDREGVSLSARDGRLRISPHVYNSETDLEHAVTRVATLAAGAASTR
jgi:selenocysteine lyase/cysteine desulfurase